MAFASPRSTPNGLREVVGDAAGAARSTAVSAEAYAVMISVSTSGWIEGLGLSRSGSMPFILGMRRSVTQQVVGLLLQAPQGGLAVE